MIGTPLFDSTAILDLATTAAPVLKWAGGKGQLLPELRQRYPHGLETGTIRTYAEPFFGGGAVFFDLVQTYPQLECAYLFDVNYELVILYRVIKQDVNALIRELQPLSKRYLALGEEGRKSCYYEMRDAYNAELADLDKGCYSDTWPRRAAQTVFLNKTCFNGLFRVNSKGGFNVPVGRYKNPKILDEPRLRAAAAALQKAVIGLGDFSQVTELADERTFVYYDPPYRPISDTSSFTSYMQGEFNDDDQRRLAAHFQALDKRGVKQLLSNSDPTNHVEDPFFDELYEGFCIERIDANRVVNSKASGRGTIRELLIRNYES